MNRVASLLLVAALALFSGPTLSASPADYPPYSFEDGPFEQFKTQLVYDFDMGEGLFNSGDISVEVSEAEYMSIKLKIRTSGRMLYSNFDCSPATKVFTADLDHNGLRDIIVLEHSIANGLGLQGSEAHFFLWTSENPLKYKEISIGDGGDDNHLALVYPSIEDFVDINHDGICEIILGGFFYGAYEGWRHNYFSYSVFSFENGNFTNVSNRFKGFPKFVWFSYEPNDKDTSKLPADLRANHIRAIEESIYIERVVPEE